MVRRKVDESGLVWVEFFRGFYEINQLGQIRRTVGAMGTWKDRPILHKSSWDLEHVNLSAEGFRAQIHVPTLLRILEREGAFDIEGDKNA